MSCPTPQRRAGVFAPASGAKQIVVGVADLQFSSTPRTELITYALGSCIAVIVWDSTTHISGLLHYMLPDSSSSTAKARARPAMFCDTGVPRLFRGLVSRGADRDSLVVKIAGGGQIDDTSGVFDIGRRNTVAVRNLLNRAGVYVAVWDVGGKKPRTVRLEVDTGQTWVRTRGREMPL